MENPQGIPGMKPSDLNASLDAAQDARQGETPSLRVLQHQAASRLRHAGIESARLDARILLGHAGSLNRDQLLIRADQPAPPETAAQFETLIARRLAREPVSRILGRREFWSLDFLLSPDTLDPRPDSETVIEAALATPAKPPATILDLGTGSGCLLLALLNEWPDAHGLGIDASHGAVAVAAANALHLRLADRARFEVWDWRPGLAGRLTPKRFDLIVANPPYIADADIPGLEPEVFQFEPRAALAGGTDGLDAYRLLAPQIPDLLSIGGIAVFEVGAGQAEAVATLLAAAGLTVLGRRTDLGGVERCVIATRDREEAGQKKG